MRRDPGSDPVVGAVPFGLPHSAALSKGPPRGHLKKLVHLCLSSADKNATVASLFGLHATAHVPLVDMLTASH